MRITLPRQGALALLLPFAAPAGAMQIRGYDATIHDRFSNFPAAPQLNPGFLYNASRFTALAWHDGTDVSMNRRQFALVTRRHCLFAKHAYSIFSSGTALHFVKAGGGGISRSIVGISDVVPYDSATATDLILVTLNQPIEAGEGIEPFPYLDLPAEDDYLGKELIAFGWFVRAGRGSITGFTEVEINATTTRALVFNYPFSGGTPDDARLEGGDSGAPSFIEVDGIPALVGIHSAIETRPNRQENIDSFIPAYVGELDALLEPQGFRMRPANAGATTLVAGTVAPFGTLRRGNPGEVSWTLSNSGGNPGGNLEFTLTFVPGGSPDSITGAGWVAVARTAGSWLVRKARLDAGESTRLTARWDSLPPATALAGTLALASDKAPPVEGGFTLALAPSFAEWAAGLSQPGLLDDPDGDGLNNLIEYALGGDPEGGSPLLAGTHPLLPVPEHENGSATLSFPERTDKELRGLSYVVEFSPDLSPGSWISDPPPGITASTVPHDPPVDGFTRRIVSWPATSAAVFARMRVELAE